MGGLGTRAAVTLHFQAAGGAPTKQGAKKQKPIYKTTAKEAARDASRGLKQTGIASFFSR